MLVYEKKYLAIGLILVSISFLYFQFFYSYHLFLKEQLLLFLYSSDYFLSYFSKPAWLVCYIGDFLTQFFYLKTGGPLVLSILFFFEWLLSSIIIQKLTKTNYATLWALFPIAAEFGLYGSISHSVSISVSFIFVLLVFFIYSSIQNTKWRLGFSYIMALVGFWLAGALFIFFPLLVIINERKNSRSIIFGWLIFSLIILILPLLSRKFYLLTIQQAYIYPALDSKSVFLFFVLILSVLMSFLLKKLEILHPLPLSVSVVLISIGGLVFGLWNNASFKLEKILSLDSETYFGNSDRVLELSQKYELKTRLASYYTNMALAKNGELPEKLMGSYQPASEGLFLPVNPSESWLTIFFSNEAYYLIGDMNLAQHSAMLGSIFSPYQRSSRMIKRLAEINLINQDFPAAAKYLNLLKKTLFHRKWALQKEQQNYSKASNSWLDKKQSQIAKADTIRFPNDYIASLDLLTKQASDNQIALDYLLCYYLLNKDVKSFKETYAHYFNKGKGAIPSVYSEALLILLFSSRASQEEVLSYGIPAQKVNDFLTYTQIFEKTKGDLNALKDKFSKTYWFYYHFATFK